MALAEEPEREIGADLPARAGDEDAHAAVAAIGEARDQGAKALEAFAYRYPERETTSERFLVHRTVFPRDFLEDFGFETVRTHGRVELCRLELAGLAPIEEGRRAKVCRIIQEAFVPPDCARRCRLRVGPQRQKPRFRRP